MRDALALLDREEIGEPRERIAEKPEVLLPVARRERERSHRGEGEGQRRVITLPRGKAEVAEDLIAVDARRLVRGVGSG
jgi:hypothetical protein